MALRLRLSGELVCAAENGPMAGDIYIDDREHYKYACRALKDGVITADDFLLWMGERKDEIS